MDYKSISAGELSSILGVQRSNISHILNGRNKPGATFIEKLLLNFPDLNARWLFTGEGKMLEKQDDSNTIIKQNNKPETKTEHSTIPFDVPPAQEVNKESNTDTKVVKVVLFYSDGTFKDFSSRD